MIHFGFSLLILVSLLSLTGCGSHCGTDGWDNLFRLGARQNQNCTSESASTSAVGLSVTVPNSTRTLWVDDNVTPRTLTFTHSGSSAYCSRDGGASFGSCDSTSSLVWLTSDYSQKHIIRAYGNNGYYEDYEFTPSSQYSGVSFISCDEEEDGTNNTFDLFESSRLGTGSKVICLTNGVTINNSVALNGDDMTFGGDNTTIVVRQGQTAGFVSTRNSGTSAQMSVFTATGRTGIKLVGVTIDFNTGGSGWAVMADSSSQDIQILHSTITNSGVAGSAYTVNIDGNSGSTTPIKIHDSSISVAEGKMGAFVDSGTLVVTDSVITSKYQGIRVSIGSTATVTNSTIFCDGSSDATDYPLFNFRGTLTVTNSTIKDGCGNGAIAIDDNTFTGGVTNIEGSTLKRTAQITGNTGTALKALNGSGGNQFNSSANQNLVCNESTATVGFTGMSTGTYAGSWSDTSQLNGNPATISDCP
ncbi:MAG: hypothetical protein H6624_07205 [Bdellovibrionaceae bacterium]|nr:hypothetical protein [Bdellovibrionales bacterium]MCB9084115.1 hypothetical protein [Pseudobdellovibrionaceae bacterium]